MQVNSKKNSSEFGLIPMLNNDHQKKPAVAKNEINLRDRDNEKVVPAVRLKRSSWNSTTFDSEDFNT